MPTHKQQGKWLIAGLCLMMGAITGAVAPDRTGPIFTADGRMVPPTDYRDWIYLSTGLNMTYGANAMPADHAMFDNVFVNPAAYRVFQKTGHWPNGAILVLEGRGGQSKGSINQHGQYQSGPVQGLEVHVKDTTRFKDGWGFFSFEKTEPAPKIPDSASCYSCHAAHAAVDTTFVQFYPTLVPIAEAHHSQSAAYLKEEAERQPDPAP